MSPSTTYTFDDLWAAIRVLAPKQPIERDKDHILSLIIPNLIAQFHSNELFDANLSEATEEEWNAVELLQLSYYHLCNGGVYNLKEENDS